MQWLVRYSTKGEGTVEILQLQDNNTYRTSKVNKLLGK
jgi:hypothetical protein